MPDTLRTMRESRRTDTAMQPRLHPRSPRSGHSSGDSVSDGRTAQRAVRPDRGAGRPRPPGEAGANRLPARAARAQVPPAPHHQPHSSWWHATGGTPAGALRVRGQILRSIDTLLSRSAGGLRRTLEHITVDFYQQICYHSVISREQTRRMVRPPERLFLFYVAESKQSRIFW